jgi:hypothetical protein
MKIKVGPNGPPGPWRRPIEFVSVPHGKNNFSSKRIPPKRTLMNQRKVNITVTLILVNVVSYTTHFKDLPLTH